jgi:hypothetical protein
MLLTLTPELAKKRYMVASGCRYHPDQATAGRCGYCERKFCAGCEIEIGGEVLICIDCAAGFARQKLRQASVVTGMGLLFGLMMAAEAAGREDWHYAIGDPPAFAYLFFAAFFGWNYGEKLWECLFALSDRFEGPNSVIVAIPILVLRLAVSLILGALGGAMVQFLKCRRLLRRQKKLCSVEASRSSMRRI